MNIQQITAALAKAEAKKAALENSSDIDTYYAKIDKIDDAIMYYNELLLEYEAEMKREKYEEKYESMIIFFEENYLCNIDDVVIRQIVESTYERYKEQEEKYGIENIEQSYINIFGGNYDYDCEYNTRRITYMNAQKLRVADYAANDAFHSYRIMYNHDIEKTITNIKKWLISIDEYVDPYSGRRDNKLKLSRKLDIKTRRINAKTAV